MKDIINKLILLIFLVPFVSACTEDTLENKTVTQLEVIATFNEPGTRANMSIRENSLDVVSRWNGSDHLKVFCSKTGEEYSEEFKDISISEVIDEGRSAKFVFEPLKSWKNDNGEIDDDSKFAYITNRCFPVYDKDAKKLFINASLLRNPLENFLAPVYSLSEYSEYSLIQAHFQHYYTYELLHISNNTGKTIHFKFNGFEGTHWFKDRGSICLDDGEFYQESVATRGRSEEFAEMDIEPNETRILMSAYIPNGQKVDNAVLWANIDNKDVSTTNTLSSNVELQTGHAYHMYVTWNGTELKFGKDNDIEVPEGFVDLGLPSRTLWAICNLDADKQEDNGNYMAWGELRGFDEGKTSFSWSNYAFCKGTSNSLTKYCTKSVYGANGFTDNLVELTTDDDCVSRTLGFPYAIPNKAEWDELIRECKWSKLDNGALVRGKNGNVIFLPCAGYRQGVNLYDNGSEGYYWTSTLDVNSPDDAWFVYIGNGKANDYDYYRCSGRSIRPIMRNVSGSSAAKPMAPASTIETHPVEKAIEGGMVVKTMSGTAH